MLIAGLGSIAAGRVTAQTFTNLHSFTGAKADGANPNGSLTLLSATLYGMTYGGGTSGCGVVFRINTDGIGYTNLHSFAGGSADGAYPVGSLTLGSNTLYGVTSQGGASGKGVAFRINTDGSGYTNLHSFAGGYFDGANPRGPLVLNGQTLYGMTHEGGMSTFGSSSYGFFGNSLGIFHWPI